MNKFIGVFIAILFLLQFSFLPFVEIEINLLLAVVLILAQRRFDFSGVVWVFVCGALVDIFSSHMFGLNILSFVLIVFLTSFANSFFIAFESNRFINTAVYLVGKIFFDLIKYYLGAIFVLVGVFDSNVVVMPKLFSSSYFFSLIFFSVISFVLLLLYEKLEKFSGEKMQKLIINKK